MSSNLLDGATVTRGTKDADGYWVLSQNDGTDKKDSPMWRIDGQPTLEENQTIHMACSVMPDEDWGSNAARMSVQYTDGAGHSNWTGTDMGAARVGAWTRLEAEIVVPSGMRIDRFLLSNAYSYAAGAKVSNPVFSYGSAVTLASSAHTPYATQDHVSVTYATQASLKVTDDSIKAEVSARAQTDQNVADLSSRLTQTADSLTSEISDRRSAITTVTGLANAAQSTADAAKSSASNAVSTANSASSSAANAVETANAASSSAASAVDTANSASSTASAASTAASKASTDAAAAVKTANSASSTASGAVSTANGAVSTANAASDTATKAQTMATENQSSIKQLSDSITSEVARKVSVGSGGTVTDLSSVMEQSADGVLFKFSKTVGGATYQPAIELTTDTDYDDGRTVNSAIKMWESMSARAGGGDPVTEINGSTMRINKVVLVESLRVGGWVLRAVSDSSDGSELIEIRSV